MQWLEEFPGGVSSPRVNLNSMAGPSQASCGEPVCSSVTTPNMSEANVHPCLLLIDDEMTLLEMLGMLLENKGYEVITASSVSGALILWDLNRDRIKAVISDTWLSSTESTTELLASFKKAMPEVPVI